LFFYAKVLNMNENSALGYDEFFEADRVKLGLGDFLVARVVSECRGSYKIKNKKDEYLAKITGKQIFKATSREDYPAVGDWVTFSELDNKQAIIHEILSRRTVIKRKHSGKNEIQIIAANIDVVFIVESVDRDYSLNRLERYFSIVNEGKAKPVVILNKIDLISKETLLLKVSQIKKRFNDIDVILTSVKVLGELNDFKKYIIKEKTYCFLGSSGVGKSSLINMLLGKNIVKIGNIGQYSDRGKHTTTTRDMYFLKNGGMVIDNPGIREVGLTETSIGIDNLFDEIKTLSRECKYVDCAHVQEPGCKVLAALKFGELDKERYFNYIALKKESEHYSLINVQKKEKNHQFGKFIKKSKTDFKNYKHRSY